MPHAVDLPNVLPLPLTPENADAVRYVDTTPEEGLAQLKLLQMEGCKPHNRVLEIGCGALIAGFPTMQYVDRGNYVGIDPNTWLIQASEREPSVRLVIEAKAAKFLDNSDFNGSILGPYDFVLSHSILSHAALWQLQQFMDKTFKVLSQGGKVVASLRLAEGNRYGSSRCRRTDAFYKEWVYPGNSYFRRRTVAKEAKKRGFDIRFAEEMTQLITSVNPRSFHDWIVLTRGC